jgi:hypothetical protein
VGVSVGEGKFCPFFQPSPKIFWCLGHLPQAAVSRYYVKKMIILSFFFDADARDAAGDAARWVRPR